MATARDYVETALREIGVLARTEAADPDDATQGLLRLNRFIDRLATEKLTIYTITRTTWTIVASTGQYTVGSGGDVNITRPVWVERINYADTSQDPDYEYPLRRLTENEWQRLTLKGLTSTLPDSYYYNDTFPLATVDFWPIPTEGDLEGVIYHSEALSQIANLSSTITLPPGYEEMLISNLAILLCPMYGKDPHPVLVDTARRSMGDIKRANIKDNELMLEASASFPANRNNSNRYYNIYQD